MRFVILITLACFYTHSAGNPLALSKQKIGESPSGFQLIHVGPGKPGSAIVTEQQILNRITGSLEKLRTLEIKGNNKSPNHYTLVLLKKPTYSNFNFSTRFKIIEGDGIRAAGIFFRMQDNLKDYYLLAVKPVTKEAFWTVYKDNLAIRGFRYDEENFSPPKDGWQTISLLCKGNKISWTLNDREDFLAYNTETVPDYRAGLIGFWVRSDSRVLFVNSEVLTLKEHRQKQLSMFLRKISLDHRRILSLQIATRDNKNKMPIVFASLNPKEIGQEAHDIVSKVLEKKQTYYGEKKDVFTITAPLYDRNATTIAVIRMRVKTIPKSTKPQDLIYGKKIIKLIEQQVPDRESLFN